MKLIEQVRTTHAAAMQAFADYCRRTTTRNSERAVGPRCRWCPAFDKAKDTCTISGKSGEER